MARNYVGPRRQAQAWARLAEGVDPASLDLAARARNDPELAALLARQALRRGRAVGSASRGALPAVPDADRPEPAGAVLDKHGWARSWGSFLSAVRDKSDPLGAQAACRKAMDAARPRNAAMSERVPAEGGFLVPERLRSQVLAYMTGSIVQAQASLVPMDSQRVPIPVLENTSQANGAQALGGLTFSFTDEGQPIPASVPNFSRIALDAWPDKALMQDVPNELIEDSPAFTDFFLPQVIARGLGWHVDDVALYQGTGVGQPQALANAPGAVSVTRNTSSKVLHLDVVAMLKALHPASKERAWWLLSEDAFDFLLELYETVGTAPSGQDIAAPQTLVYDMEYGCWRLLGLPCFVNDHQPQVGTAADVMLCDLSLLLLGQRDVMTAEVAPHAGFARNTSHIRLRYRWDCRFWPQSAITLANGKVTSPLVVLH